MATEVIMPKVDMVMDDGTFVEWLKQEGEQVEKGDPLFVVLTDKANIEIEAPASGILSGVTAQPDDVIPVTEVIAYILEPGEALPAAAESAPPAAATPTAEVETETVSLPEPVAVQVNDDRYPWRSLREGLVTLYWYEGDDAFARELMDTAQQALVRLRSDTGAGLESPARIYIYAKSEDLLGAMIFPQEWTGGVAYTRFSTIAIGIPTNNLDWGKRAMTHELTHLVIHQMVFNPYNDLPTWLDEGLAMYTEGPLEPVFVNLLVKAINENRLITVRSLASPFSAYAEESALAYAQSYSLVDLLINNYGQSRMLELLNAFREGSGYDEALLKVYDFDMDGLNKLWLSYIVK